MYTEEASSKAFSEASGKESVRTLRILAIRQLASQVTSLRFGVLSLLVVLLAGSHAFFARMEFHETLAQHQSRLTTHQGWLDFAKTYNEFIPCLERVPNPLRLISAGVDSRFGSTIVLPGHFSPPSILKLYSGDGFVSGSLASMDITHVIALVGTLLAVFICFDAVSGERERGTTKLLLSMAVPRSSLLTAHYISSVCCATVPVAVALMLTLFIQREFILLEQHWDAVLVVLILSYLLVSLFVLLSLYVSLVSRSSAQSLMLLLLCWAFLSGIAPNVVGESAHLLVQAPRDKLVSRQSFRPGAIPGQHEHSPIVEHGAVRGGVFRPYAEYPDEFTAGVSGMRTVPRMYSQYRVYRLLSVLSPVDVYLSGTSEACGTDPGTFVHYVETAQQHQRSLMQWQEHVIRGAPHRGIWTTSADPPLDTEGFGGIPPYGGRRISESTPMAARCLLTLLLWNVLGAIVVFRLWRPHTGRESTTELVGR